MWLGAMHRSAQMTIGRACSILAPRFAFHHRASRCLYQLHSRIGVMNDSSIHLPTRRAFSAQSDIINYEQERKTFQLVVPEYFNFCHDVIDRWAEKEKTGERSTELPAYWWTDGRDSELKWSFQDLTRESKRVASLLTEGCGLKRGETVIVLLPRIPEWWLINLACIRAGLILSPGTVTLRAKDIEHRLLSSQACCIIADSSCAGLVEQVAPKSPDLRSKIYIGPEEETLSGWVNYRTLLKTASNNFKTCRTKADEPMTVFFTSGTTGAPKMTEHTHTSYPLGHVITANYMLGVGSRDVMWNLSDTGWAKSAYSSLFAPWLNGACVFILSSSRFDPKETLQVLCKYPVTHFCSAPTALRMMVKEDLKQYKFRALRKTICAGEPVNPELIDEWKEGTGLMVYEGYGQTETTLLCSTMPGMAYKASSMGKACPGVDLQIVDDDGQILPCGTEGNIGLRYRPDRPVGLFTRYVDDAHRTASVFCGDFYLTGDRGIMDEEGYIFFVGRADDVINSAGYRIGPFEVESALLEHHAVLESAVVSSPDPARGEVVKAFVVLTPPYLTYDKDKLTKELQDHVKSTTAPHKYPRKVEYVEALPKTVSGKIRRVELRNKEWGRI